MELRHNNEKGFTLVELLVAMLIFTIGVAALTQTLLATIKGNSLGSRETIAANIANKKLDELRGINPSSFYTDPRLTGSATGAGAGTHNTGTGLGYVVPTLLGGLTQSTPRDRVQPELYRDRSAHGERGPILLKHETGQCYCFLAEPLISQRHDKFCFGT